MIVGAGSAGCVLAERLSTRHSVVLIEAGQSASAMEVKVPAAFSKLFKTSQDWDFMSAPEPGADGRSLYLPRGKMLGGSSSMNAMLYIRGRVSDYDGWEAAGAPGWGWEQVGPVFVEMESNSRGPGKHHGGAGPVRVEDQRSPNPATRAFIDAAIAAGVTPNNDFNGPKQDGVGLFQVTQRRGRRWSAADAFLKPALDRPTLEVLTGATATKVLVEEGRAVGVEFVNEGSLQRVTADREVIVSTGSFGSPHLLQLSGIGPADHLATIGVDVVVDLPGVGANLQDHPVAPVMYDSLRKGTLDDAENAVETIRWLLFRRGRLTSPVAEAGAFVRSNPTLEEPDLEFHFGPVAFDGHGLKPYPGHAFTFGPVLVNPRSRGRVLATTADPTVGPRIEVGVLTEPEDLDALISGVEIAREIASQTPLEGFRGHEVLPGPDVQTRDQLVDYVRRKVELLYHPAGTCRMGSDEGAVVDHQLRVRGLDGLRVVDASVMPTVTSGNTNAPTLMIAERASRMILETQSSNGSEG